MDSSHESDRCEECDVREARIESQGREIEALRDRLRTYEVLEESTLLRELVHATRALSRRFLPCVGQLRQYPPRPLRVPARYSRTPAPAPAPTVSIVTPVRDAATSMEQTLRSVLDQGYPALQYVVQDGGSTDGTREIVERYADRLHGVESCPDAGRTEAVNRGFARTNGEIMAWLSADDLLLPGALAYVAGYFRAHPEVDVVYGHRILIDVHGREVARWVLPPHEDEILRWADYVPQETLFWRRSAWERVGGRVDERFRFALDWDLLLRWIDAGVRLVRLPRFIGAFRVHEGQLSARDLQTVGYPEMDALRARCHGRVVATREIRRAISPYLWRARIYQALYRAGLLRY